MNLAHLLARSARLNPLNPALLRGATTLADYRGFADAAARLAGGFRDRFKLAPGDRVAIFMENAPDYLIALWGAWFAGLVVVPINAKLHPREALYAIQNSGAAALIVSDGFAAPLGALLAEAPDCAQALTPGDATWRRLLEAEALTEPVARDPDDAAWLFYTSGTTGRPKGVTISHRNLFAMTSCYFTDVDVADPRDAIVYAAPISHGAGLYNFPNVLKAARHVTPESGHFEPAELVALSRGVGRLTMFAAPTMVKRLVEHVAAAGADPSGFRTIVYGGGPMYVEDIRRALEVMGERFVQIYGQGESPMTITALSREQIGDRAHPRWLERLASVGVAQSLVEVRVGDADGRPLPVGETGEVMARGAPVMQGYWRDPEASAKALREGWLFTGDVGALDSDGFLTLKDRSKDVVISGGSNIYPREVEEALLAHPGVAEASVIGRRDPDWGEIVVAVVAARPGAQVSEAELDAICLARIARFKRPKVYRFVEALPKNAYGKVLKTALREMDARED